MAFPKKSTETTVITAPNIVHATLRIRGTAPLVINKFSAKAMAQMKANMTTAKAAKGSKKDREPRDFDENFRQAHHVATDGWFGIPASAFRAAMIRACSLVRGAPPMTQAKMSVFVDADGIDADNGVPLVKIIADAPERLEMVARNETGVPDIRVRPMWRKWECVLRLSFDADMITTESVVNLLSRAGLQVGVCEGRPFSHKSTGMGWGTFEIVPTEASSEAA